MSLIFTADHEGGTNGGNVTTGNSPYTSFSTTRPVFTNAQKITGALAMRVQTTSSAIECALYTHGSSLSLAFIRAYVYFDDLPPTSEFLRVQATTTIRAECRYNASANGGAGGFQMRNSTTSVWNSTLVPQVDTWYRIEWRVDNTNSQQQMRIFHGANLHGTTPDVDSGNQTYNQGTVNRFVWGHGATYANVNTIFDDCAVENATWVGPATVSQDATLTASVGTATAAGGSSSLRGDATLTGSAGTATAAGGSGSFTGDARLTSSTGTATAAGGEGTLHGQAHATLTSATGTATAAGGTGSLHGDAALSSSTGTATASGGVGSMSGSGTATLTSDTGQATAAGGTGALRGDARLTSSTGTATAGGGVGSLTGQASVTVTSSTGTATAAGGTGALHGGATLTSTTGTATASGAAGTLHGGAVLRSDPATSTATGGQGSLHAAATLTSDTGTATAAGGESSMFAFAPRDITLTGGLAPRRVAGDLNARHHGTLTAVDRDGALTTTRRGGLAPAHRRTGRIEPT